MSSDISETPDISNFIEPNSLLITTGMAYKDNANAFCDLIKELNALPITGIAIKLGRFIDTLDKQIIDLANELGFPLLQIPMDMTLGITCHQILSYLWDYQNEKLQYSIKIQQNFSKMLIQKATPTHLIKQLGYILKSNILLMDPFMDIIATNILAGKDGEIIKLAHKYIKTNFEMYKNLSKELNINIKISGKYLNAVAFPVNVNSLSPYLLVVLDYNNIPYPFSQLVVEQVANIIAFTLFKEHTDFENKLTTDVNMFQKFIGKNNNLKKREDFLNFGENFGIKDSTCYKVIIAGVDNFEELNHSNKHDIYYKCIACVYKRLKANCKDTLVFALVNKSQIAILLQDKINNIEELLREIANTLENYLNIYISFALGSEFHEISFIWYSYIEAQKTFEKNKRLNIKSFIKNYYSTGIDDLIQFIPETHSSHFALTVLKELAYPEDVFYQELRKTLKTYLDCQGDITQTSKCLFIHRNTVKYRIEKLNDILGYEINDHKKSLEIRLALIITDTDQGQD